MRIVFEGFWAGFTPYSTRGDALILATLKEFGPVDVLDTENWARRPCAVDVIVFSVFGPRWYLRQYARQAVLFSGESELRFPLPRGTKFDLVIASERLGVDNGLSEHFVWFWNPDTPTQRISAPPSTQRTRFCAFVYSNPQAMYRRELHATLTATYRRVDCAGRVDPNTARVDGNHESSALVKFYQNYRWVIAAENCSHLGYITEKICLAFAAGAIPIYWGAPDISEYFNPAAFVDCRRCGSIAEVVAVVAEIDADPVRYEAMRTAPLFVEDHVPAALSGVNAASAVRRLVSMT